MSPAPLPNPSVESVDWPRGSVKAVTSRDECPLHSHLPPDRPSVESGSSAPSSQTLSDPLSWPRVPTESSKTRASGLCRPRGPPAFCRLWENWDQASLVGPWLGSSVKPQGQRALNGHIDFPTGGKQAGCWPQLLQPWAVNCLRRGWGGC